MMIKYQFLQLLIAITLIVSKVSSSSNNWIIKQPHLIRTGFTNILWEYVDSSEFKVNQNVTKECKLSLNHVNQSMSEGQDWPIKLFEASGSIPDDFSGYGFVAFGNFDQCKQLNWINYDGNNQRASYCLTSFLPNNKTINLSENIFTSSKLISCEYGACFKIAFCLPSDCSSNDLQIIASNALKPYDWDLFSVDHCIVNETFIHKLIKASILQKLCLVLLIVIISTVLVANILEYKSSKLNNNNNNNENNNYNQSNWFHHLSFKSSYRQIVQPNWSSNRILVFLKFSTIVHCIGLCYHIIGWSAVNKTITLTLSGCFIPVPRGIVRNFLAPTISSDWYVEGLFVYGGFARSMELWKKVGPTTKFPQLIISTLTKLFSLSLLLLFILIIHVNLPLIFSSGPYNLLTRESNQCLNNFWQTIFLQNNHPKDIDNLCLIHFWSVSAESQLLMVIVVLVFLYKRYPKIGLTCNLITMITSLLYIGFFYYNYQYPAHIFSGGDDESFSSIENFATSVYLRTMSHLWMYSSTTLFTNIIMNDYVPTITKIPICKKINENLVTFGFSLFLIQPIYHNLIQPYQNQLILAIYVVVFRVICLVFWFFVASRNSDKSNRISDESSEKNGSLKESTNHQEIDQKKSIDLKNEEKQLKFYSIVATILKSTYCVHVTVITIILNSMRHQIVTFADMFAFVLLQLTACIFGGLLFHFFILGPFTSIFVSMKKEKIKSN